MKMFGLAVVLAMVAGQVSALSCMRPNPVKSFQNAAQGEDTYYVLYGALDFDASLMPKGVVNEPRDPAPVPAKFSGHSLSKAGFVTPYVNTVTLQATCVGPWCGSHAPNVMSLMFARVADEQIIIEARPCGGQIFQEPSEALLQGMTACMNGNCN